MKPRQIFAYLPLLAVALALIFFYQHGHYRRLTEAYERNLIANGQELSMTKLAPPRRHDPQRGLAFANLVGNFPKISNYPSAMRILSPGVVLAGYPRLSAAEMSHYDEHVREVAQVRELLGTNLLGYDVNYSLGIAIPLTYLASQKSAAQRIDATFLQALATNDRPEAASALFTGVDLVRLYDDNPMLICDLVRFAIASIASDATWDALQSGELDDQQLAGLQARWLDLNLFLRTESVLRLTRALDHDALAQVRSRGLAIVMGTSSSPASSSGDLFDTIGDTVKGVGSKIRDWQWKTSWSYDEELYVLQTYEPALEAVRQAQANDAFAPAASQLDQQLSNLARLHPPTHLAVYGGWGATLNGYLQKAATAETVRRLIVTAIALRRYQLAHHAYPASLDALVPEYLQKVPIDFMDGNPLRYKLQPDGNYLLYSAGEDGVDNGGDPTPTVPGAVNDWKHGRDLVWPRAATAAEAADYDSKHPSSPLKR